MRMTFREFAPHRLAFVRVTGPFGQGSAQAMTDVKRWASRRGLLLDDSVLYGIPMDDPSKTLPDECRYDAAIVVGDSFELDNAVGEGALRGGAYAVFDVPHTEEGVRAAWSEIFSEIAIRGLDVDDAPIIERYTAELLERHACELCVPIRINVQNASKDWRHRWNLLLIRKIGDRIDQAPRLKNSIRPRRRICLGLNPISATEPIALWLNTVGPPDIPLSLLSRRTSVTVIGR